MVTSPDFTTRARTEMFSIFQAYQANQRRVADLVDEVAAMGGATGIYGAGGANFPDQGDDFDYSDMVNALVGEPTLAQKQTIIRARRD